MQAQYKRAGISVGFCLLVLAAVPGWQITAAYRANYELQTDINDLAAQPAARVGLAPLARKTSSAAASSPRRKITGFNLIR